MKSNTHKTKTRLLTLLLAVILAIPVIAVTTPTTTYAADYKISKMSATWYVKGADDVKLRKTPSTKKSYVMTNCIKYGTKVSVIGKVINNKLDKKNTWYKVKV